MQSPRLKTLEIEELSVFLCMHIAHFCVPVHVQWWAQQYSGSGPCQIKNKRVIMTMKLQTTADKWHIGLITGDFWTPS